MVVRECYFLWETYGCDNQTKLDGMCGEKSHLISSNNSSAFIFNMYFVGHSVRTTNRRRASTKTTLIALMFLLMDMLMFLLATILVFIPFHVRDVMRSYGNSKAKREIQIQTI